MNQQPEPAPKIPNPAARWLQPVSIVLGIAVIAAVAIYLVRDKPTDAPATASRGSAQPSGRDAASDDSDGRKSEDSETGSASRGASGHESRSARQTADEKGEKANEFAALKGKWIRADSPYVIEIKQVDTDGEMEASYLNPSPIHVSAAKAIREGSITLVLIELRDTGYPGCIYRLGHNTRDDRLEGTYFQAATQQQFPVVFLRMPSAADP